MDQTAVEDLFLAALEKPEPERHDFLEAACGPNAALRARIERLLAGHAKAGGFLDVSLAKTDAQSHGPESGAVIAGRYKLLESIGDGGMGSVWVAEQTEPVRRKVAIKLIKAGMDSKSVLARFEAERQALAVMDHPNIAKVLDGGLTESERPFFVMEYVKGVPITEYCDAVRLSVPERLSLFVQVCHAVQHAHQKGIIHRDLKPSNILVAPYDDRPVPKVIDFGLAKAMHQSLTDRTLHTAHETVLGTPLYMSPEQAQLNNLDVDTRSDVYSLGVLLYELLTGTTPLEKQRFKQAAWDEVKRIIREEEPPRPSARLSSTDTLPSLAAGRQTEPARLTKLVRGELDWIVMKSLEKDRSRRYETPNGFAADIQRYLSGEPVLAAPPSARYRLRKLARKHRAALSTAAAIALLLLAGVSISTWQAVRATRAESAARLAQQGEAERAEGERMAKQEAQSAAAAEKAAKEQAQKRLAQIEKSNEVVTSIFTDLDIRQVKAGSEPLEAVLAQRLVKAAEQLEGEAVGDPLAVAGLQDRLGVSLVSLGHPQDAIPLFAKARATRTANLGADHIATLTSEGNLARGYRHAGKLDLALPLLEENVKHWKTRPDHPFALTSMQNLADVYRAVGKLDLALPLLEETLKLRKAKAGLNDPNTLIAMGNLASGYMAAGKLKLAVPRLEETLKLQTATLGSNHPHTITSMNNLALGYYQLGKPDMALPLFEEAVKLNKSRQGVGHPDTLMSMRNLASSYEAVGKLDLAFPLWEETVALCKAKLGAEHPDTLMTMNNLALGHENAGELDRALALFLEAATAFERRGFRDKSAGTVVGNLAGCYQRLKQFDQAEAWRRKSLAIVKEHAGRDSALYAGELAALALNLIQQKKWAEAEPVIRESLAIREKRTPNMWSTFNTKSMLGGALLVQKKYADAEPLLLAGYKGMKEREAKIAADGKPRLSEALDRLIDLYTATNKPDEVKKWKAERAKYPTKEPAKK